MMDRRQFVNFIALIAAGAAARPEQIEAYRQYYEANTPRTGGELIAVDEIFISGMATRSMRVLPVFTSSDGKTMVLGLNAFGGIVRWLAAPEQKIMTIKNKFTWEITSPDLRENEDLLSMLVGQVSYIDSNSVRHNVPIDSMALA